MSEDTQKALSAINQLGKQADPDFKKRIEEKSHNDVYAVSKAFSDAKAHIAFWGTILAGIFVLFLLILIGTLLCKHAFNLLDDTLKTAAFISHAWTFLGGAVAAVTIISSTKKK